MDFIPSKNADLLGYATAQSAKVTATPTAYGLTPTIATTLAGLVTSFATTQAAATNPATKGPAASLARRQSKTNLKAYIRQINKIVQADPAVTVEQKQALGLPLHAGGKTPAPIPGQPAVAISSVVGRVIKIKITDPANPTRRGKPPGVQGITLFTHVGPTPPLDQDDWKFEANLSRTIVDVTFPSTVATGATVWFTCFYYNDRKQSGVAATPISATLQGGNTVSAMAA